MEGNMSENSGRSKLGQGKRTLVENAQVLPTCFCLE